MEVFFKKEFTQRTGSFKERGARSYSCYMPDFIYFVFFFLKKTRLFFFRYALMCLSADQKKRGVIAASAGNHALGLAYHGIFLFVCMYVCT